MDLGGFVDSREAERTTLAETLDRDEREVTPRKKGAKQERLRLALWRRPCRLTRQAAGRDLGAGCPAHRGIDDWTDDAMFDGIRNFQKANGLKVNAFMRPDDPTAKAINNHVQLAASQNDGLPQDHGWEYQRDVEIGGDYEFDAKGPIRIDTHNPSVGTPAPQYHLDWHMLDEHGKVIPEFRNAGTPPKPLGRHLAPLERREQVYEPPNQSPNGHRVRIWAPPQPETSNFPGTPYFKVYRKK